MLWVTMTMVYCCLELRDQILDCQRRDGVERGAGFVHQQYVGRDGDGPGDAEPLLLATGQASAGRVQPIFHLVPQVRPAQRLFGELVEAFLLVCPLQFQSGDHVVANRHGGKGVWPLEHHPDDAAHSNRADLLAVDVTAVEQHRSFDPPPGAVSCRRFRARRTVDLPHPEGPINAVTLRGLTVMLRSATALKEP